MEIDDNDTFGFEGSAYDAIESAAINEILAEEEANDQVLSFGTAEQDGQLDKVWLIKVPKFLLDRWSAVTEDDVQLGTLKVRSPPSGTGDQHLSIVIPPEILAIQPDDQPNQTPLMNRQQNNSSGTSTPVSQFDGDKMKRGSEEYKMVMREGSVKNTYAFVEGRELGGGVTASPTLLGTIVHDCSVEIQVASETYRQLLRQRVIDSGPRRTTMKLDLTQDQSSRLTSGATMGRQNQEFGDFALSQKQKHTNGDIRNARIPRNELLDQLFTAFNQREGWTIKELRERLKQPEAWLKEVLSQIAVLSKKGETSNQWVLKDAFKGLGEVQRGEVKAKLEEEAKMNPDAMATDDGDGGSGYSSSDDDFDMEEIAPAD